MYYECVICLSLNHSSRFHCWHCGTIPAKYSITGVPSRLADFDSWCEFVNVVAAQGCLRAVQHHATKIYFRTQPLDYYADEN